MPENLFVEAGMDPQALTDFHLVAAHAGLTKAARRSGRSKSTLSRHIKAIEYRLSVVLFDRSTGSLELTTSGRDLFNRTSGLVQRLRDLERELADAIIQFQAPPVR